MRGLGYRVLGFGGLGFRVEGYEVMIGDPGEGPHSRFAQNSVRKCCSTCLQF